MAIRTFWHLEEFGRIRLSRHFFMRDFLHSEIGGFFGLRNLPIDEALAVANARILCETILEPLWATFGQVHVRSGYRAPALNAFGNARGLKCSSNEKTYADHIFDVPDADGHLGATACIVLPWFLDRARQPADWVKLAWYLHDHLPSYHRMVFFQRQTAFNIGWHEKPRREVFSYVPPKGWLIRSGTLEGWGNHRALYEDFNFPPFRLPPRDEARAPDLASDRSRCELIASRCASA